MDDDRQAYVQHMNILHGPQELFDVKALVEACTDRWYNQTLCRVNDCVLRLGIFEGEYHWHKHDRDDELFFTLDGVLLLDVEGSGTVELGPRQGYVVPKGIVHRTRALDKTVVLMVETAEITPLGDP